LAQTGKPNLSGSVPRDRSGKPDLSGIWLRTPPPRQSSRGDVFVLENLLSRMPPGADIPLQPWAEELFKKRVESFAADRPSGRCLPHGIPDAMSFHPSTLGCSMRRAFFQQIRANFAFAFQLVQRYSEKISLKVGLCEYVCRGIGT